MRCATRRFVIVPLLFALSSVGCSPDRLVEPSSPLTTRTDRALRTAKDVPSESLYYARITLKKGAPREYRDSLYAMGATYVSQFHGMRPIGIDATPEVMRSVHRLPWVRVVHADTGRSAFHPTAPPPSARTFAGVMTQFVPWGVDSIRARYVQTTNGFTGSNIKVLVVDDGIICDHDDLTTYGGYDFVEENSGLCDDPGEHGTRVASIIGALDNSLDIVGVAPGAKLYNGRVCNGTTCPLGRIIDALNWAGLYSMDVVSLSLGDCGQADPETFAEYVEALYLDGVPVVVAHADNANCQVTDPPSSLATVPYVIAVAGHEEDNDSIAVNQYGSHVDISAPGWLIPALDYDGQGVTTISYLSSAVPHVAGLYALLRSAGFSGVNSMTYRIVETAVDDGTSGYDNYYGFGRIRAYPAVTPKPSITNLTTCTNGAITAYGDCEMTAVTANGAGTVSVRFVAYFSSSPGDSTVYTWGSATRDIYVPPGDYELTIKTQAKDAYGRFAAIVNTWSMPVCTGEAFAVCPEDP